MVRFVIASGLLGALIAVPVTAEQPHYTSENVIKGWETDFSGRPPFKRALKTVPVEDIASLQIESEPVETEQKRVTDFAGKPPFKREVVEVAIVDTASLEILDSLNVDVEDSIRTKTGFKRHR